MTKEQELNDKQKAFCLEYIIDFNGSQAAIRAGYSKKAAGATSSRLLTNAKVQAEIQRQIENRTKRTEITADSVVKQLEKIAFMDIKNVVEWGVEQRHTVDDGKLARDDEGKLITVPVEYVRPKDMAEVDGTLIQSVKMGKYGFQLEIPDRMKAFEMLSKHLGVYDEMPTTVVNIAPYAEALKAAVEQKDIWEDFDNGAPGGGTNGED